jgi:hypothetical protein
MASNLECVGLAASDNKQLEGLVQSALADAQLMGTAGDVSVYGWQDPSGVRMMIATRERQLVDFLPSYAGVPGARLAGVHAVNDEVAIADVVDESGDTMTMLAVELEQRCFLPLGAAPMDGAACVVAFGVDVSVHTDEDAFAASDASLLSPGTDPGEPPEHVVEQGLSWPTRMAGESFMSYGVFGPPEQAQAYARLHGTVLHAERRTVAATGQLFIVARVRTVGFEADLCLPATAVGPIPQPGNIIGGEVFLVASMPSIAAQ